LVGLGPIINRWKYLVGGAVALAAIVSIVVALLLPNIYKSTAVFFPTNPQTADPDRMLEMNNDLKGRLELGGRPEDLDRAITIGESQPVAELIIKKFDLYKHYNAGTPGDDNADNAVLNEFTNSLTIVHNERDAIELTFMDEDKNAGRGRSQCHGARHRLGEPAANAGKPPPGARTSTARATTT
jgi:uncharacterized protein involved in exopolysaccharide biosynthesis